MFALCKPSNRSEDAAFYHQPFDLGELNCCARGFIVIDILFYHFALHWIVDSSWWFINLVNTYYFSRRTRLGLDANTSKIDKSALRRRLDISYDTKASPSSIVKSSTSVANRSAPSSTQSPLLPLLPQIALISTRRKKDNEKKRNLLKLKRRLALSLTSSLKKLRFVNMDKIRGTHNKYHHKYKQRHSSIHPSIWWTQFNRMPAIKKGNRE